MLYKLFKVQEEITILTPVVFSIELTDRDNFILQDSGRYAHSHNYIIYLANRYHFTIESNSNVGIRKEKGEWIPGSIYALRYIG